MNPRVSRLARARGTVPIASSRGGSAPRSTIRKGNRQRQTLMAMLGNSFPWPNCPFLFGHTLEPRAPGSGTHRAHPPGDAGRSCRWLPPAHQLPTTASRAAEASQTPVEGPPQRPRPRLLKRHEPSTPVLLGRRWCSKGLPTVRLPHFAFPIVMPSFLRRDRVWSMSAVNVASHALVGLGTAGACRRRRWPRRPSGCEKTTQVPVVGNAAIHVTPPASMVTSPQFGKQVKGLNRWPCPIPRRSSSCPTLSPPRDAKLRVSPPTTYRLGPLWALTSPTDTAIVRYHNTNDNTLDGAQALPRPGPAPCVTPRTGCQEHRHSHVSHTIKSSR